MAITMAWNRLQHAAKAIRERCAEGLLTASNRNNPSTTKKLRNIGSHSLSFICISQFACHRSLPKGYMRPTKDSPTSPKITCRVRSRFTLAAPRVEWCRVSRISDGTVYTDFGVVLQKYIPTRMKAGPQEAHRCSTVPS